MQLSVVLTTHNRPELLAECVRSVITQTSTDWELIIVDDGSTIPVTLDMAGASLLPQKVRIIRHAQPKSVSAARNSGIEAATCDFVTFVDDDDLIAVDALDKVSALLARAPEVDCLFLQVEPFGPYAEGTRQNQAATMSRILDELGIVTRTGLCPLPDPHALFIALLKGLPMAFQRPVLRKSTLLTKIGEYTGQGWGDIEMYYRVALRCRCAILMDPLYRVRCEGQSYFSRIDAQGAMLDAVIRIRESLLSLPEVERTPVLLHAVQKSLSAARFEKAHLSLMSDAPFPWSDFVRSLQGGVGWPHLSLLLKVPLRLLGRREPWS